MQRDEGDDAPVVRDFLDWFNQQPGTMLSAKVQLKDIHDAGRGLVAVDNISEGEDLFRIPRGLIMDTSTSSLRQHIPEQLDALNPWLAMILVLIYESLQGEKSKWWPYIRLLPNKFDTLMFWSKEELAELQASAVVQKIGKKSAEDAFAFELAPPVVQHQDLFPNIRKDHEILRLGHIAGSCVMAYAFDVEKDDEGRDDESLVTDDEENPAKAMVPFADMLNADAAKNNAHLAQEEDCFIMKAINPISAGEEIFNTYGELPRSDLLRRYGYVADSYAEYDIAEVSHELIEQVAMSQGMTRKSIQKALAPVDEVGALDDGYTLERTTSDKVKDVISTELFMVIKALCKESRKVEDEGNESRIDGLYMSEVSFLHTLIVNRIGEYSTSLEEDQQILANGRPGKREFMALQVRIGEKEILHHARAVMEAWLKARNEEAANENKKRKQPSGSNSNGNGKSAKSQRTR